MAPRRVRGQEARGGARRLGVALLFLGSLWILPAPAARAARPWSGTFRGGLAFFTGVGLGGGLGRTRFDGEKDSRYAASLPVTLRVGLDIGRYGLAVLADAQWATHFGPARDQGPQPANRSGRFGLASVAGEVLFRPLGPLYVQLGAGAAFTAGKQDMFADPASARTLLVAGIGFIYRMPRSGAHRRYWPFGLSLGFESRYYVPWDQDFLHYSLQVVLTGYFLVGGG